jgi:hypothetical protein
VSAPRTHADLWATSADHAESEDVYWDRWEIPRLILEAGGEPITREKVATWRPRPDHKITLRDVLLTGHEMQT